MDYGHLQQFRPVGRGRRRGDLPVNGESVLIFMVLPAGGLTGHRGRLHLGQPQLARDLVVRLRLVDWRRSPAHGADTRVTHPLGRRPRAVGKASTAGSFAFSPRGYRQPLGRNGRRSGLGTGRPRPGRAPAVSLLAGVRGQSAPARDVLLRILIAAWHHELERREPIWSTRPTRTVSERG